MESCISIGNPDRTQHGHVGLSGAISVGRTLAYHYSLAIDIAHSCPAVGFSLELDVIVRLELNRRQGRHAFFEMSQEQFAGRRGRGRTEQGALGRHGLESNEAGAELLHT